VTDNRLTIVDHILLAARELGGDGSPFTAEDLVVQAWKRSPDHFGLQGYASQHPDSNRVLTKIMGSESPLRKKGFLRKVGSKQYQLTDVGRQAADKLAAGDSQPERRLAEMTRGLVLALRRMMRSTAFSKFVRHEPLTFGDVSGFWNISPRTSANQFADRTREADSAIEVALAQAEEAGGRVSVPGDIVVEVEQLRRLRDLAEHIRQVFASELEVIEARTDERRL